MAYTTIDKSTLYQNQVLYTGDGSSSRAITGVGFQPNLCWVKKRSSPATDHNLNTSVNLGSGTASQYVLTSNSNEKIQDNGSSYFASLDSDGFTIGNSDKVNAIDATFVAWNWKAGTQAGSANTVGDIASTVSVNTTSGFSIVSYTGTYANETVGHGLGVVPKMVIVKRTDDDDNWKTYHVATGNDKKVQLDTTAAASSFDGWNDTTPTSTVFSLGQNNGVNGSGSTYVAYCFADIRGFSKMGSYQGNSSADGTFIYTGFKPTFVTVKRTDDVSDWQMQDSQRIGYNVNNYRLMANLNDVETTSGVMDFVSNGFKFRGTPMNTTGGTFIYMAFGQPIVSNSGICATAR